MASQNDIAGWFTVLREAAAELAGADLPQPEAQKIKVLAEAGLRIGESVVTDLNRIANALEHHAFKA